jgi:hypothetical protein
MRGSEYRVHTSQDTQEHFPCLTMSCGANSHITLFLFDTYLKMRCLFGRKRDRTMVPLYNDGHSRALPTLTVRPLDIDTRSVSHAIMSSPGPRVHHVVYPINRVASPWSTFSAGLSVLHAPVSHRSVFKTIVSATVWLHNMRIWNTDHVNQITRTLLRSLTSRCISHVVYFHGFGIIPVHHIHRRWRSRSQGWRR